MMVIDPAYSAWKSNILLEIQLRDLVRQFLSLEMLVYFVH